MTINAIMNTTGAKRQPNRRLQNSRRNSLDTLEQKIEAVAYKMITDINTISPKEMKRLDDKLIKLVLVYKGFRAFANLDLIGCTMDELPNAGNFSLCMFARCYKTAWNWYSKAGIDKAKTEPFLKYFNTFYMKRESEIKHEKLSEADYWNLKAREASLNILLQEAKAASKYRGKLPQINVLNRSKFMELLSILGADQELIKKAEKIYENNIVGTDEKRDSEGEETDSLSSDSMSLNSALYQDRIMMYIADCVERALETARAEKNVFIIVHLPYYITLKAAPYMVEQFNTVRILLEDFLDKDLLEFAKKNESENHVELFSAYQKQKYNTARKKLRKVEKWLGEWAAKAA